MTDRKLLVSAGPHVRGGASTTSVMRDVLIALLPAVVASVLVFGTRALVLEIICVDVSILFEYLFRKITKRTNTISDLSAAVTGLLLAMNLPAGFPIWMAIVGCFVAIVIVKQLFGGIGCNFANPAITGRIFLLIAFAGQMTTWPTANSYIPGIDAVSGATPLALIKEGAVDSLPAVKNLLFGIRGGCLGETCAIALIIGFVYLVVRRVITQQRQQHPVAQALGAGYRLRRRRYAGHRRQIRDPLAPAAHAVHGDHLLLGAGHGHIEDAHFLGPALAL